MKIKMQIKGILEGVKQHGKRHLLLKTKTIKRFVLREIATRDEQLPMISKCVAILDLNARGGPGERLD